MSVGPIATTEHYPGTERLVLRDGSTAGVRLTTAADHDLMREFFSHLSIESLRSRFLGITRVTEAFIDRLCDSSDLRRAATLVVCRYDEGHSVRFVGVGSYFSETSPVDAAEVAFAVDDSFHRRGIATALLERLAPLAADNGFKRFDATTFAENLDMLDVFRESGFDVRTTTDRGCVDVRISLEHKRGPVCSAR